MLLPGHNPRRSLAFVPGHLRQCAPYHTQSYDVFASSCGGCGERMQELRGDRDSGTGAPSPALRCRGAALAVLRCGAIPQRFSAALGRRGLMGAFVSLFGRHSFLFPLRVYRAVKFQRLTSEVKWLIRRLISTSVRPVSASGLLFLCCAPQIRKRGFEEEVLR